MYRTFEIKNFRCFDEFKIENLERVNLIGGMNNVGKTALLEALFIYLGTYNLELTLRVNAFRGIEFTKVEFGQLSQTPWDSIFRQFDVSQQAQLGGSSTTEEHRTVKLKLIRQPDELAQVVRTLQPTVTNGSENVSLSTETSHVLCLEYVEDGNSNNYYMIFDQKGIHVSVVPPPPLPGVFLPARVRVPAGEDADRYGNLVRLKQEQAILDSLVVIEPRIRSLTTLPMGNSSVIYGDIGLRQLVPLPLMGEGINRLASIVLAIGNAKGGVVLIDEIENGLHYTILKDVWKAIGKAAREFNTQVFATTHSWECIVAAHQAFSETEYDFRYHRLDRTSEGGIRVVTYDQESLEAAKESNFEVR